MDLKKNWLYLSAFLSTAALLFFGLNIPLAFLDGMFGLDFYHFIILGLILLPFLYYFLINIAKKKVFPNYFLWFLTFVSAGIIPLILFIYELYLVIFGPCSDWCGIGLVFTIPTTIVISIISLIIFFKSNKLS